MPGRTMAMASAPSRSFWANSKAGTTRGRRIAEVLVRRQQEQAAGPFAAGGQRRFMADEKKDEKQEGKAGAGVFATFMKSIRDQMRSKTETDEELAAAQERLEQARQESLVKAEAAMQKAREAAEEASAQSPALVFMLVTWGGKPSCHAMPC